ncbi:MAG: 50S ribosomal protein L6 [bacterium]
MSRIGKLPIEIPVGVQVSVSGHVVTVKGPLGSLNYTIPEPISISIEGKTIALKRESDHREHRSLHGLARSLVANMVHGVSKGFEKNLLVEGVGYKVQLKGDSQIILNIGFSHAVKHDMPEGVSVVIDKNKITLKGIDKQKVGQTAAEIRNYRPVEPYNGKGIRYEDERVRRKEGKPGT